MFQGRFQHHADAITVLGILGVMSVLLFHWKVPPITDLLPHLNQVQAFWWAPKRADGLYQINWFAPNTFYYYILLLLCLVMPLLVAGKALWLGILALQMGGLLRLGRKLEAPYPLLLLALVLSFNLNFYWGFGNFLIAWSLFLWYVQMEDLSIYLKSFLTILIVWSHVFFILPLAVWQSLQWRRKKGTQRNPSEWISLAAVTVWFAIWMALDFGPKSSGTIAYNYSLADRLSLVWLRASVQGSLQGWPEMVMAIVLVGVLVLPPLMEEATFKSQFQRRIYLVGAALLLVGLVSPDKGMNTVRASQRWIPLAFQAMVLATPRPTRLWWQRLYQLAVSTVAVCFLVATVLAWSRFQSEDASGLQEATADIPTNSRVLTLDFIGFGSIFLTRAVMHAGDLAQVEKGAIPNSTFADNPAAFVRFARKRAYTQLLEWYPNQLRLSDLEQSDVALIGGPWKVQDEASHLGNLHPFRPINDGKYWHAYQIIK